MVALESEEPNSTDRGFDRIQIFLNRVSVTLSRKQSGNRFAAESEKPQRGVIGEMLAFVGHNKRWWLLPIFAVLLLLSVLVILGSSAAAPFIYTLF